VKNLVFIPIVIASVLVSWYIWAHSPDYIHQGGPLLVIGLTCFFLLMTFCVERLIVLWRAGGRGHVGAFLGNVKQALDGGNIRQAIDVCKQQGGCLANVMGAGLERYESLRGTGLGKKEHLAEMREAIHVAGALESPHLEKNLSAFSTIASIATMIGLLGTTIGMIRAFRAMSRAGAPDATQLALGISEALVNTALGLSTAIIAIVLYNYFTTRVDEFTNEIEDASWTVLSILGQRKEP
jgi:biopolymer transport protein ExbB